MTDDSTAEGGRVARLKAGLNLNNALGAKPPIGFRPVMPPSAPRAELHVDTTGNSGNQLEVAKRPPPPPVSPKPRAADRKDSTETKKAEVAVSAKNADVLDGPAASGFVGVSKLREKLQIALPAFNPTAHLAADTVDSASRPDAIEADSPKVANQNGGVSRLDSTDREERPAIHFASKPSPVHIMINPASLLPGTKRKTPSESAETTEEHRPLESLTKGRPKMARRRAPTSASANASTGATSNGSETVENAASDASTTHNVTANGKETESEVFVLSSRVKANDVSDAVDEVIHKSSQLKLRDGKQSSPLNAAMEVDESREAAEEQSPPAKHTDEQSSTTPTHNSDGSAGTTNARYESSSEEEDSETECTEF